MSPWVLLDVNHQRFITLNQSRLLFNHQPLNASMTDFIDVAQAAPIHVRFRNHELSLSLPGSAAGSLPKLESQILIIGEE